MARNLPDIAPFIENAILDPIVNKSRIEQVCDQSRYFGFAGVCVASRDVPIAREQLGNKGKVKLISMISFPFGSVSRDIKQAEAEWAASEGAEELDMVPNFSALINGQINSFAEEIAAICSIGLPVKVILEVSRLEGQLLALAVEASIDAGASFLKTGSGFGPPVTNEQVKHLFSLAKGRAGIKAVGGIIDLSTAISLLEAGANRLGTSRGMELMKALRNDSPIKTFNYE
uniref:Putative deoxyribose-phosphate aldolase (DeoC) n=1 Tax=Paulinella chromatophora TaxID=39717 RepID=B1X5B4_PAUCH|nr:Putative deoxyribose-phosphate aldolase (DeoC) [Paulinella chromatophora]ACB43133.1 Putative deoxyribose-phosphate aldolase (DeoC) [Paulinella chromatophora]